MVLLLAYTILGGHRAWKGSWPYPAQCVFDDIIGHVENSPAVWMEVNTVFLFTAYSQSILPLYPTLFKFFNGWAYDGPLGSMEAGIIFLRQRRTRNANSKGIAVPARFCNALWTSGLVTIKAVYISLAALLGSTYVDFLTGLGWSGYGLWVLVWDRNLTKPVVDGNENDMTFGQLVPILLLGSTVLTFKEAYDGAARITDQDADAKRSPSMNTLLTPRKVIVGSGPALSQEVEMSGDVTEDDYLEPSFLSRRIDTEEGGRTMTLSTGNNDLIQEGLQRRHTLPRVQ